MDICSATPASQPPTSSHSSRSTPSPPLAATGCSPRPPAAPAPTAPPSSSCWTSCAPWRHPGRLETRPTRPLPPAPGRQHHQPRRPRHRVPQPPGGIDTTTPGKLGLHVFALAEFERDLIRERTSAGLAAAWPAPPRRLTIGYDHPQAPGGSGNVPLWAVHHGHDRQDPWGQPRLRLSAPHWRQPLTRPPHRCDRFFKRSRLADPCMP